jgi:hypothetical protein
MGSMGGWWSRIVGCASSNWCRIGRAGFRMGIGVLLRLALLAPAAAGPLVHPDRRELGPLWHEQSSTLMWPGAYVPAFTLVPDRRRVHRLTFGIDYAALRAVSFEAVLVEPSYDPEIRRLTAGMPTGEGSQAYAWVGAKVRIPSSKWQLGVGWSGAVGVASAVARGAMGRGGLWQVNLVRPLR